MLFQKTIGESLLARFEVVLHCKLFFLWKQVHEFVISCSSGHVLSDQCPPRGLPGG